MPTKRKNNGIEPGKITKTINRVPLSPEENAKFKAMQDRYDGTAGYIAGMAISQWLKWRKA